MADMPNPDSLPKIKPNIGKGMNIKYTPKKITKPNKHWRGGKR
jgi:hypothetical protein